MGDTSQMPSAPDKISPNFIIAIYVTVITTALSTTCVILRFIARRLSSIGWDDWAILGSLVLSYGILASVILQATIGHTGYHMTQYSKTQVETLIETIEAGDMLYIASVSLSKASILIMYCRIFALRSFRICAWIMGALIFGFFLSSEMGFIFTANPVQAYWKFWLPHTTIHEKAFWVATGIVDIVLDAAILCMPQPLLWKLKLSTKKKAGLSVIFFLGGFACVASIVRVTQIEAIKLDDSTYTMTGTEIWSKIEPDVSIICACLPTLPALYRHWFAHKKLGSRKITNSGSSGSWSRLLKWRWSDRSGRSTGSSDLESGPKFSRSTSSHRLPEKGANAGYSYDLTSYPTNPRKDAARVHITTDFGWESR